MEAVRIRKVHGSPSWWASGRFRIPASGADGAPIAPPPQRSDTKVLNHPVVGPLTLDWSFLISIGGPDQ